MIVRVGDVIKFRRGHIGKITMLSCGENSYPYLKVGGAYTLINALDTKDFEGAEILGNMYDGFQLP